VNCSAVIDGHSECLQQAGSKGQWPSPTDHTVLRSIPQLPALVCSLALPYRCFLMPYLPDPLHTVACIWSGRTKGLNWRVR